MRRCDEKKPFIFISYAHKDSERVLRIMDGLDRAGYNLWYDDGIVPGAEWDENIANHVENCSYFIAFISENYIASNNCKDELKYSRDLNKEQLMVYLEDVSLPGGLAMRMNRLQAVMWYQYNVEDDAFSKLFSAPGIAKTRIMEPAENLIPMANNIPQMNRAGVPMQQTPMQQTPVQQTPMQQTPMQRAPMQQMPVTSAPMQSSSAPMVNPVAATPMPEAVVKLAATKPVQAPEVNQGVQSAKPAQIPGMNQGAQPVKPAQAPGMNQGAQPVKPTQAPGMNRNVQPPQAPVKSKPEQPATPPKKKGKKAAWVGIGVAGAAVVLVVVLVGGVILLASLGSSGDQDGSGTLADNSQTGNSSGTVSTQSKEQAEKAKEYYEAGYNYLYGNGVEADEKKAFEQFCKAVEYGDPTSMFFVGRMHETGIGAELDYDAALYYYQLGTEYNEPNCTYMLGRFYKDGIHVARDYAKAVELFEAAIAAGSVEAYGSYGNCYRDGIGVTQDYQKAMELYEKGIELGDCSSITGLGTLYAFGYGVSEDLAKGFDLFIQAVDEGNDPMAMVYLGDYYYYGKYVDRDMEEARYWYSLAAYSGSSQGAYSCGVMDENGFGEGEADYESALDWYKMARDLGMDTSEDISRVEALINGN